MRILLCVAAAGAALACAAAQAAEPTARPQTPADAELKLAAPRPNVHVLSGPGGNVTLVQGADGAIMVDSMWVASAARLKAAVDGLAKGRVRYLVITHYHADHAGGAPLFAGGGATVAGTAELARRLETGSANDGGVFSPPVPPAGRPTVMVGGTPVTIRVGGQDAVLHHPRNAHTDGDTIVYFPTANVLATGDIYTKGRMPGSDMANGGDLDGILAAYDQMLGMINDGTLVVPGHGDLATRADLAGARAQLAQARARLEPLVQQGMSEADVLAAKPFGAEFQDGFVRTLYRSIKQN